MRRITILLVPVLFTTAAARCEAFSLNIGVNNDHSRWLIEEDNVLWTDTHVQPEVPGVEAVLTYRFEESFIAIDDRFIEVPPISPIVTVGWGMQGILDLELDSSAYIVGEFSTDGEFWVESARSDSGNPPFVSPITGLSLFGVTHFTNSFGIEIDDVVYFRLTMFAGTSIDAVQAMIKHPDPPTNDSSHRGLRVRTGGLSVPEPSTYALLLLGAGLLWVVKARCCCGRR